MKVLNFYRTLSQTEKKIGQSIKINKPSAIIPASDKHTASVNCFSNKRINYSFGLFFS
jgi:hypothetical protein